MSELHAVLAGREICVCAGAGGVGKTTTAAAVALGAATAGLRVAVLTIDPARRLADSLGLEELGNDERRVDAQRLARAGVHVEGELWATTLDVKRTFDEVVERYAPDPRTRDAVLANRIYRELSGALAGSHEYMAMERLYELHAEGRYDLLVLDTPPTRNALDFLDAPERLLSFIDSRALQLFLASGRVGLRAFSAGTGVLLRILRRLTGAELLADLSEFFASVATMREGFRERATRVRDLLADERTAFLLVTSPRRHAIDEAIYFRSRLAEHGMPFGAAIVNRVRELPDAPGAEVARTAEELLGERLGRRVTRAWEDQRRLADGERAQLERLRAKLGGAPLVAVPWLDEDVHDLAGLARVGEHLFRR